MVQVLSSTRFAKPKSVIFMWPSAATSRFSGFRSRYAIFYLWRPKPIYPVVSTISMGGDQYQSNNVGFKFQNHIHMLLGSKLFVDPDPYIL